MEDGSNGSEYARDSKDTRARSFELPQPTFPPGKDSVDQSVPLRTQARGKIEETPQVPEIISEAEDHELMDTRHIADAIAEKLDLPEIQSLTFREKLAANTMKFLIRSHLLKHQPITEATFQSSKVLAGENLPRFPSAESPPTGREGESSWGAYAVRILNGNENIFGLSPQEFEEHRAASRFNVVVPVENSSHGIDMQQVVYDVFRDSENAMPWVNGTTIETTYKMDVQSKEDVVVFDARAGWQDIDPAQYKGKVVYVRTGDSNGTMDEDEQRVMKALLDSNKIVIREINDPIQGNILEAVANHNWIDANALKRAMNQVARPMGGYRAIEDSETLQQMLSDSADRYNALHPEAQTRMRTMVLEQDKVDQILEAYEEFKDSLPTYERLVEIFDYDEKKAGRASDELSAMALGFDADLTKARFIQLLVQEAAGVDGKGKNGSVLLFRSNTEEELDQFQTYGTLDDIRRHISIVNDPKSSKREARHSAKEITRILDFYNEDRSNVTGKIGAAIEQIPNEQTKVELGYATVRSGAARGNSGQVMTSYGEVVSKYMIKIKTSEKSEEIYFDTVKPGGFVSSAHPTFMDESFAITADIEDTAGGKKIKRYVISVKS